MAKKLNKANLSIDEKLEQVKVVSEYEPYKVPQNWCWTYLESINQFISRSVNPTSESNKLFELYSVPSSQENYPEIIQGGDIGSTKQSVKKDDVLLCKINPRINRVWIVSKYTENALIASSEWIVVRNSIISSKYLMWCMRSPYFREYMLSNVSGIGGSLMRAKPEHVKKYPIALAPLPEQYRIVEHIETMFSKLDEAKEKAQEILNTLEIRKNSILNKAFSGKLTKKWRKEHKIRHDSWKSSLVSECCKLGSGGTPSRRNSSYYTGNIPWIKTGEINWNIVNDSEEKITHEAIENSSAKIYDPGAVLVAMYGMGITRGKAAILGVKATTNQAVCVLQTNENLYNRFLFYFFMSNYWNIREQAVGGNQLNLSATIIGKLNIVIPKLDEQKEIVKILDDFIYKENETKQSAEYVIEQIDLMKKSILSKAFRGELGTNNPKDESAEELLKQILTGDTNAN